MYKCENCGFECGSSLLMMQHLEWCGKEKNEYEYMKKVREAKKSAQVKAMIEE